jgi:hypothetical protein
MSVLHHQPHHHHHPAAAATTATVAAKRPHPPLPQVDPFDEIAER